MLQAYRLLDITQVLTKPRQAHTSTDTGELADEREAPVRSEKSKT
jgi:hypothetical protein